MKITEINIYPVKSTSPISLRESAVLARGLPWDRRWMLVDADGNFMTARKFPTLTRVTTQLQADRLTVGAAGRDPLQLPLLATGRETIPVTIWRDRCAAVPAGDAADAWFSDYLGVACRLVRMTDDLVRGVDPDYGQAGDEVSFADGFPLLLISRASLDDLNSRLASPVSMRRFRPNLVVDGDQPYAEDGWRRMRIGAVEFEGVKNCSRCVLTTVDPDTGIKAADQEPLRTLSSYRRRAGGGVFFGQNLIPRGTGVIRVGDTLEVAAGG